RRSLLMLVVSSRLGRASARRSPSACCALDCVINAPLPEVRVSLSSSRRRGALAGISRGTLGAARATAPHGLRTEEECHGPDRAAARDAGGCVQHGGAVDRARAGRGRLL